MINSQKISIKDYIPSISHFDSDNFFLFAGPCVVESRDLVLRIAEEIARLSEKYSIPYVFKASYKKANRSRVDSFTGIGDEKALKILAEVRNKYGLPVVTDIHSVDEAVMAAAYVDVLQIPAFLCRQTDILVAAAETGKAVSIKKGQFLSSDSMRFAIEKVLDTGNRKVMITERGSMYGYHDLIVDYRSIPDMQKFQVPVILDVTHSLQQPNQRNGVSGGQPELIETISRAGIAVGVDGLFIETHPEPTKALSDGANMLPLDQLDNLLFRLTEIRKTIQRF